MSEAGTYSVTIQTAGCEAIEASKRIAEKRAADCQAPQRDPMCEPVVFPVVPNNEPCNQYSADLLIANARMKYQAYLKTKRKEFELSYLQHCLDVQEDFTMQYEDQEHHYTLYYYDQAGNLSRTVPPEGVKLLAPDALLQVREDREAQQERVFTEHELSTTYSYNSLNQLVSQDMPDHGQLELKDLSSLSQDIPTGLTITSSEFSSAQQGYLIGHDGEESHFYTTDDAGKRWSSLSKIGTEDLADVQLLANSQVGYAVGEQGTLLKSIDAGKSWQLQPMPTLGKLVAVLFFSQAEGLVFEEDGRMWYTEEGAESEAWQQDQALSNLMKGRLTGISSSGNVLLASSEDNGRGYVYRSVDAGLSWQQVNKFKSSELLALSFYNSNNGYAAGEDGRLLKTVNQGETWQIIATSTNQDFQQVHFSTSSEGYALSKEGDLLSTSNGGQTWSSVTTPATGLTAMYWTGNKGYVGKGNQLWTSSNSGSSWTEVSTSKLSGSIIGLHFAGNKGQVLLSNGSIYEQSNGNSSNWTLLDNRGLSSWSWVSASTVYGLDSQGNVWKSSDGASSWQKINSVSSGLQAIHFVSNQQGYLAGQDGKLYRSSDGGENWQEVSEAVQPLALQDISLENSTAYAVGKAGTVWKSVDAGQSFQQLKSQTKADLNSVAARSSQISIGGQAGTVLSSTTGGQSWTVSKNAEQLALLDVAYNSSNQAYLSGEDCSIINQSGALKTPVTPPDDLLSISFTGNTGIAVGEKGKIIRSSDGGSSWQMVSEVKAPVLYASQQVDSEVGYAVGKQGAILKTADAGAHWQAVATGQVADLYGLHFESPGTGVVVGEGGTILRSSNGKSFSPVNSGTSQTLRDVHAGSGLWLAVGEGGTILSSSNGSSWQSQSSGTIQNLKAVYVIDETTAYAVGEQGTILRGTNNGRNWQQLTQTNGSAWTAANLNDVYFKDYVTGYVIGSNGIILKTVTRGQSWEAETGDAGNTELLSITPQPHNANTVAITGKQGTVVSYQDETDLYGSRFFYDKLGRLVISQNAKQFNQAVPAYSYTEYDALGRITEVGEVATGEAVSGLKNSNGQIDQNKLEQWVEKGTRSQITRTYYDTVVYAVAGLEQANLRNRVSTTTYQQAEGESYDYATHYSYDIHGNVSTLIQDNPALAAIEQQYKRVEYAYDLISGNVHEVVYQKNQPDQFFHRYEYDADNRIVEVQTSSDGVVWDRDAGYEYYEHGPLARMELGEQQVQGVDYAYTIQGWLKGVNSTSLEAEKDMGQDGLAGSTNSAVAKDEFGYSLSYFNGDYSAINAPQSDLDVQVGNNLYNGNIRNMTTSIRKFMGVDGQGPTQTMAYTYDQLNRIKESQAYDNQDGQLTAKEDYKTKYSYDANGNLLSLHRNATIAEGRKLMMDELEYVYETKENGYERNTNKLRQVRDAVAAGNYSDDIDSQQKDNYAYDEIGNLVEDKQEGIANIDWTAYGKVAKVSKADGSLIAFAYDAAGNRIAKRYKNQAEDRTTHYVRDASGNVMAIYEQSRGSFKLIEQPIYGSDMVGERKVAFEMKNGGQNTDNEQVAYHSVGLKAFYLKNHLGNVQVVVSDKILMEDSDGVAESRADVLASYSYYPYGMMMPGRVYNPSENRYKYQGSESDDEISGVGNTYHTYYRTLDVRSPRWWSVDPKVRPWESPYVAMGSNPILYNDPMGDTTSYYDIQTGNLLGTINNAGELTRIKIDQGHYNAFKNFRYNNLDLDNQGNANMFVNTLNLAALSAESVSGENRIAFENSIRLTFTGTANANNPAEANGTLNVTSVFDDGSTLNLGSYQAIGGPYGNGSPENGGYTVSNLRRRNDNQGMIRDGFGFSLNLDPNFDTGRTLLRIHPDGNNAGTLGCIGLQCNENELRAFYNIMRSYLNVHRSAGTTINIDGNPDNDGRGASRRAIPDIVE